MFQKEERVTVFSFLVFRVDASQIIVKQIAGSIIDVLCMFVFRLAVQEVKVPWGSEAR